MDQGDVIRCFEAVAHLARALSFTRPSAEVAFAPVNGGKAIGDASATSVVGCHFTVTLPILGQAVMTLLQCGEFGVTVL